jgi:hypothetical protein
MIRIPEGLTDADDAAVTTLREGCELHRMTGEEIVGTACGLPEYALVHPFPSVGYAALLAQSLCPRCWQRPSVWAQLLLRAHPDRVRAVDSNSGPRFGPLNSRTRPGVG